MKSLVTALALALIGASVASCAHRPSPSAGASSQPSGSQNMAGDVANNCKGLEGAARAECDRRGTPTLR